MFSLSCSTVKDLKEALAKLPEDAILAVDGPDAGGYDVTYLNELTIRSLDAVFHPDNPDYSRFNRHSPILFLGGTGKEWYDIIREEEKENEPA